MSTACHPFPREVRIPLGVETCIVRTSEVSPSILVNEPVRVMAGSKGICHGARR